MTKFTVVLRIVIFALQRVFKAVLYFFFSTILLILKH